MEGKYLDLELKAERLFDLRAEIAVKIVESTFGVEELMKEYRKICADYEATINLIASLG